MRHAATPRGFTLIELVVALVLVGLLAWVSVPLYEVASVRTKEAELRAALRTLRTAIDAYKSAADAGLVPKGATDSGYPPSLDVLVAGVEGGRDGRRHVFLRQIPRDPFAPDPDAPAAAHWATRSYGSPPDDPQPGADVFDVASRSRRTGSNGVPYAQW
jgi:general secretion pathway protein G